MDIYPECGRVEDSLQYRSLGPRVEAGSGIRGYIQSIRSPRLHLPGCLLLGGGAQLAVLHLAHLAQLEPWRL